MSFIIIASYQFWRHILTKPIGRKELIKIYIWTISYFKHFVPMTLLYVLCGGAMIWGELMIPRRMGYLIDHVFPMKNMNLLTHQVLILFGFVLLILIAKSIYNFLEVIIANKIIKKQQTDLMVKFQKLGFGYYEKVPTGQILSMFEHSVKETQKTYTFLFPHFIYSLAQFAVPSIVLSINAPLFFIAAMVGNVIYVLLNQFANNKIQYYLSAETSAAQCAQQAIYDTVVATSEMKAMGSSEWLIQKTMKAFDTYRVPRMWSVFWRHFRFTTVGLTLTVSIILFYYFGLELVRDGSLMLGEFIGYSFLMGLVSRGFSVFFYIIPAQQHALNYAKHLYDFMQLPCDVIDVDHMIDKPIEPMDLSFKNVSFFYEEDNPILKEITIDIQAGKKTAIVGESGCGKSTLLKLIGRFYDVTEGEISIGGCDVRQFNLENLRNYIGYVFQETYLFNMTIKENIKFGNPFASDDDVISAARSASAHDFIMASENGYDTMVGERGMRLSGGEKQRLSIARMLLKAPEIVLLDEATSALDRVTEVAVKESLDELMKGRTVVAIAHRLSTIMSYDSIIVLDAGRVVEQGTYQTLMEKKGLFYRLAMRGAENVE